MKLYTRTQHKYSFDLWGPVVQNDANGTITYEFDRKVWGTIVSGRQQTYLFTPEQIPYGAMLRNMRDADGTHVFAVLGDPYDVYVHASEPVVDVYGQLTGYRQTLRRHGPSLTPGATHF